MTVVRRREWVGKGARRFAEIPPPRFASTPPVAGYTSWYDADDISLFTLTGGARVATWADKGSGANDLSVFGVTRAPVLARHPTLFRGRLATWFDGAVSANGAGVSSAASASDITQTAFVVAVLESLGVTATLLGSSADGGNQLRVDVTTGRLTTNKADTAALGTQSNAAVVAGTPFLAVQVLSATAVEHILNGVSETDAHAQTFTAGRSLQVGHSTTVGTGNEPWAGWIAEVLIYDTTLSSGDISSVSAWLRSKWDV